MNFKCAALAFFHIQRAQRRARTESETREPFGISLIVGYSRDSHVGDIPPVQFTIAFKLERKKLW